MHVKIQEKNITFSNKLFQIHAVLLHSLPFEEICCLFRPPVIPVLCISSFIHLPLLCFLLCISFPIAIPSFSRCGLYFHLIYSTYHNVCQ